MNNHQTLETSARKQGSLVRQIIAVTILPLLILSLAASIYGIAAYRDGLNHVSAEELENMAGLFLDDYNELYPGELSMKQGAGGLTFYKGDARIDGDYAPFDRVKELTGAEVSLFYQDTRILTTLKDPQGVRMIGTGANQLILSEVEGKGLSAFFPNTEIGGEVFLTWYVPIRQEDGTITGMLGMATRQKEIDQYFGMAAIPLICIAVAAVILSLWVSLSYAGNLTKELRCLQDFVREVSRENLSTELSPQLLKRNDELGAMSVSVSDMQKSLKRLIERDQLTGLYNRRFAEKKYHQTYAESMENHLDFCVCIGDIDYFKRVNDTYGHAAGDQVLMDVAAILRERMRSTGYACRFGGEEFLLVFEECALADAETALRQIMKNLKEHVVLYESFEIKVTMSFGLTEGYDFLSESALLKEADDRLYRAKEGGRNRIVSSPSPED